MENSSQSFLSLPVQFVLVMGGVLLLVAVVAGYGTNNPSVFGHSSDEIEVKFSVYKQDCTANFLGQCSVSCGANERAISGNCSSSKGFGYAVMGVVNNSTWECTDMTHFSGDTLSAEVVCVPEV